MLGDNLYAFLKSRSYKGLDQTDPLLQKIALGTLTALQCIRQLNVVHADLKPENIVLTPDGSVKVIDFGSAIILRSDRTPPSYVQSRFYRSPEVMLGQGIMYASDMWSFGCIMYEMHVGRPLFPGKTEAMMLGLQTSVLGLPPIDWLGRCPKFIRHFRVCDETVEPLEPCDNGVRIDETSLLFDLLRKTLAWEPLTRLRPLEALALPFCTQTLDDTPDST